MILVEGEKYACEQCIRGHRSSTCKHIKRPLVLVRSRGRPVTDSTQRIAIMAESLANKEVKVECQTKNKKKKCTVTAETSSSSCCCCNKDKESSSEGSLSSSVTPPITRTPSQSSEDTETTPVPIASKDQSSSGAGSVFVLKASTRKVYNVKKDSLKLLDPVAEIPNTKVGLQIMHNLSKMKRHGRSMCRTRKFNSGELLMDLNSRTKIVKGSSCCSVKKAKQGSCCCKSEDKPASKLLGSQPMNFEKLATIPMTTAVPKLEPGLPPLQTQMYDLFAADFNMLASESTCHCPPDNCTCNNCAVHTAQKTSQPEQQFPSLGSLEISSGSSPADCTTTCMCQPDECACYNCDIHGIVNGIRLADGVRVSFLEDLPPDVQLAYGMDNFIASIQQQQSPSVQDILPRQLQTLPPPVQSTSDVPPVDVMLDFSEFDDACFCEDGHCTCENCFKHGRIGNADIV